jgi:hypothetical protein
MSKFIRDSSGNSTESRVKLRRTKVIMAIQTSTTIMFTIWLLYVWIKDGHFGSQPECNHLVKYVFFFANTQATETWLRVLFITYLVFFSCALLLRFILIFFLYVGVHHKLPGVKPRVRQEIPHVKLVLSVGCVLQPGRRVLIDFIDFLIRSAVYGVATLELIVRRVSHPQSKHTQTDLGPPQPCKHPTWRGGLGLWSNPCTHLTFGMCGRYCGIYSRAVSEA